MTAPGTPTFSRRGTRTDQPDPLDRAAQDIFAHNKPTEQFGTQEGGFKEDLRRILVALGESNQFDTQSDSFGEAFLGNLLNTAGTFAQSGVDRDAERGVARTTQRDELNAQVESDQDLAQQQFENDLETRLRDSQINLNEARSTAARREDEPEDPRRTELDFNLDEALLDQRTSQTERNRRGPVDDETEEEAALQRTLGREAEGRFVDTDRRARAELGRLQEPANEFDPTPRELAAVESPDSVLGILRRELDPTFVSDSTAAMRRRGQLANPDLDERVDTALKKRFGESAHDTLTSSGTQGTTPENDSGQTPRNPEAEEFREATDEEFDLVLEELRTEQGLAPGSMISNPVEVERRLNAKGLRS